MNNLDNFCQNQTNLDLSPLECAFGEMVARRSGLPELANNVGLQYLAGLTLHVTLQSNSCLDLMAWIAQNKDLKERKKRQAEERVNAIECEAPSLEKELRLSLAKRALEEITEQCDCPEAEMWIEDILQKWSPAIAVETQEGECAPGLQPLVWVPRHNALYLRKYREAELYVRKFVTAQTRVDSPQATLDTVRKISSRFDSAGAEDQVRAVVASFQQPLAIITGGPGTGKTTTLAALLALEFQKNPELRVGLCAPTGKAADQMKQSIRDELDHLILSAAEKSTVESCLGNLNACTVHKLLGFRPSQPRPQKILPYDLVVVDECSMLSLLQCWNLLRALKMDSRLLLLGDKDQLDSVETGHVFADLCAWAQQGGEKHIALSFLTKNFRSKENPELVAFAAELSNKGVPTEAIAKQMTASLFAAASKQRESGAVFGAIQFPEPKEKQTRQDALREMLADLWKNWECPMPQAAASPAEALECLEAFKVLCAVRESGYGVIKLNELLGNIILHSNDLQRYPKGAAVMVTRNDSVTTLKNGNVGVSWDDGKVYFRSAHANPGKEGDTAAAQFLSFAQTQLPENEPAFAMTVHKSQGGSYENVVVVLPEGTGQSLLTLNLVYTAITRAKKRCLVIASPETLEKALCSVPKRWGHLLPEGVSPKFRAI